MIYDDAWCIIYDAWCILVGVIAVALFYENCGSNCVPIAIDLQRIGFLVFSF